MSVSTATRNEMPWRHEPGSPAAYDTGSLKEAARRFADRFFGHVLGPAAVFGPIAFLGATLVLESVNPGYDRVRDTISSLVWGQYGWTEAAVFCLFGASVIALVFRFGRIAPGKAGLKIARMLLMAIGAGFLIIAFCPTYHPTGATALVASIHEYTVRVMAVLFPLECAFTAAAIPDRPWRVLREYTWICAAAGAVLVIPAAVAVVTDAPWLGLIERVLLANGLIWTEAMAISTFRTPSERHSYGGGTADARPGLVALEALNVENSVSAKRYQSWLPAQED
jgi:hypothetical protein